MDDVIIIGGGIAGASAAYFLAATRRVVVLEAEPNCGMHTTGRSAALFSEGYGNAAIRALTRASRGFYTAPPEGFAAVPLLSPRGVMVIASAEEKDQFETALQDTAAAAAELPVLLDSEEAKRLVPILRTDYVAHAFLDAAAMDIDVDALHQGFLRGARQRGAKIVTQAAVRQLERRDGGWRVETSAGTFEAKAVVNAAGAWADQIAMMAGARPRGLVPKRRTAALVPAPPGFDAAQWPAVIGATETFYFKPSSGLILVSPADETPSEPCDVQPDELDVAIAVDRVQQAADLPVRRIARAWAGLRCFFKDKTPAVGWDAETPGFFWLAGQGGYGIQTAPAMGRLTAALVCGEAVPDEIARTGLDPALLSPNRAALAGAS